MAASAASRAALLGLALLVLQRSPAGALSDISPERAVRGGSMHASTNRTPAESQPHHNHHQHGVSGGHRIAHSAAYGAGQPLQEPYRPHNKKFLSSPEGTEAGDVLETTIKKLRRGEEVPSSPAVSGDLDTVDTNNNEGGIVLPSASVGLNGAAAIAATPFLGSGHSSTVLNMPPRPGTYIPSNCSTCRVREELRNMSLQSIKEQILNKLGMKHAPNTTGRPIPKIPPIHHLLDLYGMQSDQPDRVFQPGPVIHEEEDDFHAKTTMVIAVAQTTKLRHGGGIGNDLDIQHFRFSERSIRNKVAEASMFIYVPVTSRPVRVLVYRVVGNATEHESMTVLLVASSKLSEQRKPSWVELDANKLLVDWFKNPRDNLGVVVKIEDDTGLSIPYTIESDNKEESKQPFVRVHTTDGKKKRNKRTIGLNCHENSQETRCCRYPLTVDFEEFGWDWIIAPKKYDANYCSGECPYVFLQKYPHTHIVQQANPAGTAGPCCAPRKMSPISMLYFDNEFNIIYGLLPGMVVDRCGCQ